MWKTCTRVGQKQCDIYTQASAYGKGHLRAFRNSFETKYNFLKKLTEAKTIHMHSWQKMTFCCPLISSESLEFLLQLKKLIMKL